MKKLIYLFLTVVIVACSSSDDSNEQSLNTQFVGSWELIFEDNPDNSLILEFNADGTGSETEIFEGKTYADTFSWSSTNTTITVSYDDDGDGFSAEYDFLTVDQVKFTINEQGDVYEVIFDRID